MSNEKLKNIIAMEKEVTVGEAVYTIKKLPLGQYAKVLLILKNMPTGVLKDVQALDTNDEGALISTLFGVIAEAWEQVVDIIAIGSGIDKKVIAEDPTIGLEGGVALLMAIWEINNLQSVFNTVKNAMTRKAAK